MIDPLLHRMTRLLEALMAALMVGMVVLVLGNVVLRYAFNSGITLSEELSRWMFVWLCFLGAVVAVKEHAHLGTDMLVSRLGANARRALLLLAQLAMLGVNALLLQGAWRQVQINWDVTAPVSELSMGWFYLSGVVFAVLASLLLAVQLARTLSGRLKPEDMRMVQESEDMQQVDELHLDQSGTYKHRR